MKSENSGDLRRVHGAIADARGKTAEATVEGTGDRAQAGKTESPPFESTEAYKFLLEHSSDIILVLNKLGRILYCNHSALAGFGYSKTELLGQSIARFLTRKSLKRAFFALTQEFLGHPQPELELEVRSKSGEVRLISVAESSAPIRRNGAMLGIMVTARDVTDQRRADLELKESERRYRDLWENAPVAYHVADREGVITAANQTEARMLGYSKEELIGRPVFELMPPEQRAEAEGRFRKKIAGQFPVKSRNRIFLRKDGSKVRVAVDDTLERNGEGKISGIRSTLVDITRLSESEEALRKSEEQFRDVVEKSGFAIVIDDRDGRVTYFNARFADILGYSAEEMKGRTIWTIVHPEDAAKLREYHGGRVRGENVPSRYEMRAIRKDGGTIFLEVDVIAVEEGGRLVGTHSYIRDITEHKRSEEKRRETEARFRAIAEYSPDTILILDDSFHIIYANPASIELSGYSLEESIGQDFRAFIDVESRGIAGDLYLRLLRKEDVPQRYEYGIVRKNGERRRIEVTSSLVTAENGKPNVIAQVRDITDRKAGEEALRESEEKFKAITVSAQDAIIMMDPFGRVSYWNQAAERIFGYTAEEAIGLEIHSQLVPQPFSGMFAESFRRFRETGLGSAIGRILELEAVRKDGTPLPIELSLSAVTLRGEWHAVGIIRDITERRKAKEQLEESYRKLKRSMEGVIQAIALTVDMRDPYTSDHQRKVARLATAIAAEMKISPEQIEAIRIASLLHDMGKLAVPAEILNKPGRLDAEELQLIREHPKTGFDILSKIDLPDKIAQIVYQHHERMNGSGYPRGLAGQEILLEARILSVAEAVEAMTAHRPYRPAFDLKNALAQISREKGFLYDPDVVEACIAVFTRNGFKPKLAELRP